MNLIRERCPFMNIEQIEREMLRPQRERLIQIAIPCRNGLSRQARDEIEAHIIEICLAKLTKCCIYIFRTMRAAKLTKLLIVKGLCAEACAINSQIAKRSH